MPPNKHAAEEVSEETSKPTTDDPTYKWSKDHTGEILSINELPLQRIRVDSFFANFCPGPVNSSTLYNDMIEFFLTKIVFDDESIFDKVRLKEIHDENTAEFGYSFLTDPDNKELFKTGYKQFPAGITDHIVYDIADPGTEPTYTLKEDFVAEYRANIQYFLSLLLVFFYAKSEPPFSSGHLRWLHIANTPRPNNEPRPALFTTPDLGNRSFRISHSGAPSLKVTLWDYEELQELLELNLHSYELAAMVIIYLVDVLPFCRAHPELGFGHSDWFFTDCRPVAPAEGDAEKGAAVDADGDVDMSAEKPAEKKPAAKPFVDQPWPLKTFEAALRRETKQRTGVEMGQEHFEKVYIGIMEKRTKWTFHQGYFRLP